MLGIQWRERGTFERWQASRLRSERVPRSLESVHAYMILDNTGFPEISVHFPHIFSYFPIFPHSLRKFSEKILSFPHTVLKFQYKNRFVLHGTALTFGFTFESRSPLYVPNLRSRILPNVPSIVWESGEQIPRHLLRSRHQPEVCEILLGSRNQI